MCFLIKTSQKCLRSNEPKFLLFCTNAVHGCPKGLADYNLNFILLFLFSNVYHYPPLVIMAESQPRLISIIRTRSKRKRTLREQNGFLPAGSPVLGNAIFIHTVAGSACPGAYLVTLLLAGTYL